MYLVLYMILRLVWLSGYKKIVAQISVKERVKVFLYLLLKVLLENEMTAFSRMELVYKWSKRPK